jgi:hypothetical protein
MKKWSLVVAALYGLILMALFGPLLSIAFMRKGELKIEWPVEMLTEWSVWLTITVLGLAQFALLRVPVEVANRRPVKQRSLWSTVLAAAFMMGLVVYGAGMALWEFIDHLTKIKGWGDGHWVVLALGLTSWALWAVYFYRATKNSTPELQMSRFKRYLWTGSILDLLVAIPTHIYVRHRDLCCAGFGTFVGLTCGISVMLFAFGPAVYFLFAERWKRLHPKD